MISLPLFLSFIPPRVHPLSPPYYPPRIQQVARYLNEREMMMSDIPWAMAWYGERQCVWLTADGRKEFFEIHDFHKSVNGLYVSTRTSDARFYSNWGGENRTWGRFVQTLHSACTRRLPPPQPSPQGKGGRRK